MSRYTLWRIPGLSKIVGWAEVRSPTIIKALHVVALAKRRSAQPTALEIVLKYTGLQEGDLK